MTAKIFGILCSLVLMIFAMPAESQVSRASCGNPDPDISIAACTRKIESDAADLKAGRGMMQAAAARLATDYDSRGVAYAQKGLYDQAIADYNQAISLSPRDFPVAYFNRGSAYNNQGLDDLAIRDYTTAIAQEPEGEGPNLKLADMYDYRGNAYEHKGLRRSHRRFHHGDFAQFRLGKRLPKSGQ
jgi:tetratricopeptide (TPR) repeat protein